MAQIPNSPILIPPSHSGKATPTASKKSQGLGPSGLYENPFEEPSKSGGTQEHGPGPDGLYSNPFEDSGNIY